MNTSLVKLNRRNPTTKEAHATTRTTQTERFENEISPMIDGFFRTFCIASLLRANGAYKQSGIRVITIFQKLFALAFSGRSLFISLKVPFLGIGKDTFCRLLIEYIKAYEAAGANGAMVAEPAAGLMSASLA